MPLSDSTKINEKSALTLKVAKEILDSKFSKAEIIFAAGSIIRGDLTLYSDLDLVIVFKELDFAWRESFPSLGFR